MINRRAIQYSSARGAWLRYGFLMRNIEERHLAGLDYLGAVTALLQRVRKAHPTKGLYEAGEVQWWWGEAPRDTDTLGQLFWFDEQGHPEAAVIVTWWRDWITIDPILMPDATPEWVAHVVERGLAHAAESGFADLELEVDRADDVLREALIGRGFAMREEGLVEAWLEADARPEISPLHKDYRLATRLNTMEHPHHMIKRMGLDVEQRLLQTSLYRSDLDLFILDANDNAVAFGLFWYDPENATGAVEPMRTDDDHQRRGLARHILTAGIDQLARAGAERIKITFDTDNLAASHLYLSVGFEPVKQTDLYAGQSRKPTA